MFLAWCHWFESICSFHPFEYTILHSFHVYNCYKPILHYLQTQELLISPSLCSFSTCLMIHEHSSGHIEEVLLKTDEVLPYKDNGYAQHNYLPHHIIQTLNWSVTYDLHEKIHFSSSLAHMDKFESVTPQTPLNLSTQAVSLDKSFPEISLEMVTWYSSSSNPNFVQKRSYSPLDLFVIISLYLCTHVLAKMGA